MTDVSIAPKISYCSTCMNRGWQLKQTLPQNLATLDRFQGAAELCLVNFIKDDEGREIHDWVLQLGPRPNFHYFVCDSLPYWHAPIAKNTAHQQASGNFLINLDCDNFISAFVLEELLERSKAGRLNGVFSGFTGRLEVRRIKERGLSRIVELARGPRYVCPDKRQFKSKTARWVLRSQRSGPDQGFNGTYGHIGLPRILFAFLNGYDETFPPMGGQDKDLLWRAFNCNGIELIHIPQPRDCLPVLNDKEASLAHAATPSARWSEMQVSANEKALDSIRARCLIANPDGRYGLKARRIF